MSNPRVLMTDQLTPEQEFTNVGLHISLLGGFLLRQGDETFGSERFRLRKACSLIKLLALAPRQRLPRDQVLEWLWPDGEPGASTNSLHQVLRSARQVVETLHPPCFIRFEEESLSLHSDPLLRIDVEAFESAAAKALQHKNPTFYQAALSLYTGDLLPEDPYEEWAVHRREVLQQTYLDLLLNLARLHETRHEYQPAIDAYKRFIITDPLHEEAHAGLMRSLALSGHRSQALRQYQLLQETLSRELEAEPDPATKRLHQHILDGSFSPPESELHADSLSIPAQVAKRHNLPAQLTHFIGRQHEIAQVMTLLADHRLVTLTGSGGVGKTRLALKVAEEMLDSFSQGVWLVELAPVSDPELVPQTVATSLGLREEPGRELTDTLTYFLKDRQALLVLDNCEHLLEASARLSDALLKKAPLLKIIVSSREALEIAGESTYRVPSLAAPDPRRILSLSEFKEYEAVRLFVDRAQAVLPSFQVDEQNTPSIAQICHRLDGIPLALELAAARLNLLTTEQLASRLDNAFRLLSGGNRTALPRQQTLRATIDWSYQLLSEGERRLLRRMAVFAGGGTLEAIEAVCAGEDLDASEILDLLSGLANKSMINVERAQHAETRYQLLETVRQYAREKLNDGGESATFYDRHLDYYLRLAETIEPQLRTSIALEKLEVLNHEIDNLRASLSWAMDEDTSPRLAAGLRLAGSLMEFWQTKNFYFEGYSWLVKGLTAIREDDPSFVMICAKARFAAGQLLFPLGRFSEAQQYLAESLETYQQIGDAAGQAMAQCLLGVALAWIDNSSPQAKEFCEQSLTTARTLKDPWLLAWVLSRYGACANSQKDYSLARGLLAESLSILEQVGDKLQVGYVFLALGGTSYKQGDYSEAHYFLKKTMEAGQARESNMLIGTSLGILGEVAYMQDDFEQMEANFRLAQEKHLEGGLRIPNMWILRGLGIAYKRLGRLHQSVACFLESLALAQEGNDLYGIYAAMAGLAGAALLLGYPSRAVSLLGAVEALFTAFIKPLDPWEMREFNHDVVNAQAALSADEFSQAWAEGHTMTLERAIQEISALEAEIQSLQ